MRALNFLDFAGRPVKSGNADILYLYWRGERVYLGVKLEVRGIPKSTTLAVTPEVGTQNLDTIPVHYKEGRSGRVKVIDWLGKEP